MVTLPKNWNPQLQSDVHRLVKDVPEICHLNSNGEGNPTTRNPFSMKDFPSFFPDLDIVDPGGDGYSCQYAAVAEAACGTRDAVDDLRRLAVMGIQRDWNSIGDVVMSEVADQCQLDLAQLDFESCCSLFLGDKNRQPIWGNQATLAQLPNVVNKNIVVLTMSHTAGPIKHVFNATRPDGTIHIGFVPECHFFGVKAKQRSENGNNSFSEICSLFLE